MGIRDSYKELIRLMNYRPSENEEGAYVNTYNEFDKEKEEFDTWTILVTFNSTHITVEAFLNGDIEEHRYIPYTDPAQLFNFLETYAESKKEIGGMN